VIKGEASSVAAVCPSPFEPNVRPTDLRTPENGKNVSLAILATGQIGVVTGVTVMLIEHSSTIDACPVDAPLHGRRQR